MKPEVRYKILLSVAHVAWWTSLILTAFITLTPEDRRPRTLGVLVVFLIGVAIASGMALGRMRLTAAIIAAFQAGMESTSDRLESSAARVAHKAAEDTARMVDQVARESVQQVTETVKVQDEIRVKGEISLKEGT